MKLCIFLAVTVDLLITMASVLLSVVFVDDNFVVSLDYLFNVRHAAVTNLERISIEYFMKCVRCGRILILS